MRTVVLVHGAWHGSWCWASTLAGLDDRGVPAVAVDLPGPDLHTDADHVRSVLDGVGPDGAVLAGHSYGGAVITDAGAHSAVRHLVYLCAFVLDEGETTADRATAWPEEPALAGAMRIADDGTCTVDPAMAAEVFYADCDPLDAQRSTSLLRPQSLATFAGAPRSIGWRTVPSTYLVCGEDRAVPPGLQRDMAARLPGAAVVEWPGASHSPFLSRPGDVADLLAGLAA